MSRESLLYLKDMLTCCEKIQHYIGDMDRASFEADGRTYDAVVRNLEVIGEAAKHTPVEI